MSDTKLVNFTEAKLQTNEAEMIRKPVKLTMKQGLLLNQVLSFYGLENVEDDLCRKHIQEFKKSLRAFEPWALQSKYLSPIFEKDFIRYHTCVPAMLEVDNICMPVKIDKKSDNFRKICI